MTVATLAQGGSISTDAMSASDKLDQFLRRGELGDFRAVSDVAACLIPLLKALGWRGDLAYLAVALPHFSDQLDVEGLRAVLANLNFTSRPAEAALHQIDSRLLPCLFVPKKGPAMVVLSHEDDGGIVVFRGDTSEISRDEDVNAQGVAYFFREVETDSIDIAPEAAPKVWSSGIARRFRGLLSQMLLVTLFTSLLALAVPLFIMTVYDRVIPAASHHLLLYLAGGMAVALIFDVGLRVIRGRMLAYLGGRIDVLLGSAVFQQIMHLPVVMTERASIGSQLSRLRQFDAVREFFTGPLATVVLELPFAILFIATIAIIAGPLAWMPVILIALFCLVGAVLFPSMRRAVANSAEARARRQVFIIELLSQMRQVKTSAVEPLWSERYREISAQTSLTQFKSSQTANVAQTIAQALMLGAGIATLGLGTLMVIAGDITVGALVATMALIWRVLAPLQMGFLSITRFEQIRSVIRQVNQLMRLDVERAPGSVPNRLRSFRGEIVFNRVTLRHSPTSEPALMGIQFAVEAGKIVVVTGTNGSGKTTLLRMVAGLYQPQGGNVLIDGLDIRQLDVAELRNAVAFVPQSSQLFHGTISQNLRLANPLATDDEIREAARDADLHDDILALPEGFETRLTDQLQRQLPNGFKQRLMLARAYVKKSPIYLLDEPGRHLDASGDQALMRKLESLRGNATVLMVTHRPSHMRLADQIAYISGGQILVAGTPEEILPKLGLA